MRTGDVHAELAREAEAKDRTLTAGEAYVRAALCYHFAKYLWLLDLDKCRATTKKSVASLRAAHRLLDPTAERLEFSLNGGTMVGNLRRPAGQKRSPLLLLIPGLDSTKEEFVHGKLDWAFPYQEVERMAAEAPRGELVLFPEGNHSCTNIPYKHTPLESDWMREQLLRAG